VVLFPVEHAPIQASLSEREREIPYEPSIPNENHHHRPTRRGQPMKPSTIGAILWEVESTHGNMLRTVWSTCGGRLWWWHCKSSDESGFDGQHSLGLISMK
jgi:hypothetical protein